MRPWLIARRKQDGGRPLRVARTARRQRGGGEIIDMLGEELVTLTRELALGTCRPTLPLRKWLEFLLQTA